MSVNYSKVRLKIGVNEIEIYGVKEDMEYLSQLALKIYEGISKNVPQSQGKVTIIEKEEEQSKQAENIIQLPDIQPDPNSSLPANILKLFVSEWGKKPRRLSEVKEVLDSFGLVYPKQTVAVSLLRLAKEGKIRRFKNERGEYVYISVPSKILQEEQGETA
ncbi:MAG: hypothetical protein ACP5LF_00860 [Nitrososphaeria archaeon]|nr:hypothetical protein [Conexivisphaerales archaeon]